MRRLIDAARQPRGNDKTGFPEIARQRAGELDSGAGSVARPDHGDDWPHQSVKRPAHAEQGRRVVEYRKPRRIAVFIWRNQADAKVCACLKLRARIRLARDALRL